MPSAVLLIVALCSCIVTLREMRRRRALELEITELRAQARVPGVPELRNHEWFTEDLEREISRADRTGRPASLVVQSVDSGPAAVAHAIRNGVRGVDVGYRIGADEFAVILPETRARGALVAARRVEDRLLDGGTPPGTVSAGIAELGPGIDRHQLFRNAYCALLAAGREGRSRLLVYSPDLEPVRGGGRSSGPALAEPVE